jgi:hypothetical protein
VIVTRLRTSSVDQRAKSGPWAHRTQPQWGAGLRRPVDLQAVTKNARLAYGEHRRPYPDLIRRSLFGWTYGSGEEGDKVGRVHVGQRSSMAKPAFFAIAIGGAVKDEMF